MNIESKLSKEIIQVPFYIIQYTQQQRIRQEKKSNLHKEIKNKIS